MRLIGWISAIVLGSLVLFLSVRAVSFFPQAWKEFGNRGQKPGQVQRIDSTLFDQESAGSADLTRVVTDSSLDAVLERGRDSLGIFRKRTSVVGGKDSPVPLYSLEFHKGVPMVERVQELCTKLSAYGFGVLESTERPRATWPWAMHVVHGERLVAVIRGRASADPSPSTFRMHLAFWGDQAEVPMKLVSSLPKGTLVALPPEAWSGAEASEIRTRRGLEPVVMVRLETSLFAVSRQEKDRVLLHHSKREIEDRLATRDSAAKFLKGVAVVDGDRGAADPDLASRLSEAFQRRRWWVMDGTGFAVSRIGEQTVSHGLDQVETPRRGQGPVLGQLQVAEERALSEGEAYILLPLDSAVVRSVVSYLPAMARRGVAVSPWPVLHRRTKRE